MACWKLEDHTILVLVERLGDDQRSSELPLGWLLNACSKDIQGLVEMVSISNQSSAVLCREWPRLAIVLVIHDYLGYGCIDVASVVKDDHLLGLSLLGGSPFSSLFLFLDAVNIVFYFLSHFFQPSETLLELIEELHNLRISSLINKVHLLHELVRDLVVTFFLFHPLNRLFQQDLVCIALIAIICF